MVRPEACAATRARNLWTYFAPGNTGDLETAAASAPDQVLSSSVNVGDELPMARDVEHQHTVGAWMWTSFRPASDLRCESAWRPADGFESWDGSVTLGKGTAHRANRSTARPHGGRGRRRRDEREQRRLRESRKCPARRPRLAGAGAAAAAGVSDEAALVELKARFASDFGNECYFIADEGSWADSDAVDEVTRFGPLESHFSTPGLYDAGFETIVLTPGVWDPLSDVPALPRDGGSQYGSAWDLAQQVQSFDPDADYLFAGDVAWGDIVVSARLSIQDIAGDYYGLFTRVQPGAAFDALYFGTASNNSALQLWEMNIQSPDAHNATTNLLRSANVVSLGTAWHALEVRMLGTNSDFVFEGGTPTFSQSVTNTQGRIGLCVGYADGHAYWDNVIVRQYVSPEPSVTLEPPSDIVCP